MKKCQKSNLFLRGCPGTNSFLEHLSSRRAIYANNKDENDTEREGVKMKRVRGEMMVKDMTSSVNKKSRQMI